MRPLMGFVAGLLAGLVLGAIGAIGVGAVVSYQQKEEGG